jgi:hypothetical protein
MNYIYEEQKKHGSAEELANLIDAYECGEDVDFGWNNGGIDEAEEALDLLMADEDRELEAEDYECNLHYFRRRYERIEAIGELVNAYEVEELQGVDVQDYSIDGAIRIVNMLAAASLSVITSHGSKSTLAAAINAAHEMEAAHLEGMISLKRVLGRKVVA